MKKRKPRQFTRQLFWAYYAPDGNLQTRSMQNKKYLAQEAIAQREYHPDGTKVTHLDYEAAGYVLCRVVATVHIIEIK